MKRLIFKLIFILIFCNCDAQNLPLWKVINPLPAGNGYVKIDSIPGSGKIFALLRNNRFQVSSDSGETWFETSISDGSVSSSLYEVVDLVFTDSQHGHAISNRMTNAFSFNTNDGGMTWVSSTSSLPIEPWLRKLVFLNDSTGYAAGSSQLLIKTTDAGLTWNQLIGQTPVAINYGDLEFINDSTMLLAGSEPGKHFIIKSTDDGLNFDTLWTDSTHSISFIHVINDSVWFGGGNFTTIRTTDFGQTWSMNTNMGVKFSSLKFISKDTAFAGDPGTNIFRTTDGGITWNLLHHLIINPNNPLTNDLVGAFYFYPNGHGFFGAGKNIGYTLFYSSPDFGSSIVDVQKGIKNNPFLAIDFPTPSTGFCIGKDMIKTTDGGSSWLFYATGYNDLFTKISFTDSLRGIASGSGTNGLVSVTWDGGMSWNQSVISNKKINDAEFIDFNNIIAVGDNGSCYHSPDGGLTWNLVYLSSSDKCRQVDFYNNNGIIILDNSLRFSNDGGQTWTQSAGSGFQKIQFIDSLNIYALRYGQLHKSLDGGLSWLLLYQFQFVLPLTNFFFTDANNGYFLEYAPAPAGKFYQTNDGGQTWKYEDADLQVLWGEMYFLNPAKGFYTTWSTFAVKPYNLVSGISIGIEELSLYDDFRINIFPNPSAEILHITILGSVSEDDYIQVYDQLGKLHRCSYRLAGNQIEIDIRYLLPGIYILRFGFKDQFSSKKFIKL